MSERLLEMYEDMKELEMLESLLYDGHAVFNNLTDYARKRTSAENVSDVLDAMGRAWKKAKAGGSAPVQPPKPRN